MGNRFGRREISGKKLVYVSEDLLDAISAISKKIR
jgi:hypothetical protein